MLVIRSCLEPIITKGHAAYVEGGRMARTGEKPGKGVYICAKCKQIVNLDDDTDTMPPCPKCISIEFVVQNGTTVREDNMAFQLPENLCYAIKAKHSGKVIDIQSGSHGDGTRVQQWDLTPSDHQLFYIERHGEWCKIKAKHSGKTLDVRSGSQTDGEIIHQWRDYSTNNQLFKIEPWDGEWCKIRAKVSQKVLDVKSADMNNGAQIHQWTEYKCDNQLFKFELVNPRWDIRTDSFTPDFPAPPPDRIDIVTQRELTNNSPAKITETLSNEVSKECTFRWSFTTSFKIGVSAKFAMEIPGCGGVETEISLEAGLETNREWTKTVKRTYAIERDLTLDTRASILVRGYVDWVEDYTTPFTVELWVAAWGESKSGLRPLTRNELVEILQIHGFDRDNIVDETKDNKVKVRLRGEYTGSFGTRTFLKINELTTYRKSAGSDMWHWCTNCSEWPIPSAASVYEELKLLDGKIPDGKLCQVCASKATDGSCAKE